MSQKAFSKIWTLIVVALLLALAGFLVYQQMQTPAEEAPIEKGQEQADETASWIAYNNEDYGYEVRYPDNWILNEEKFGENSVVFEAPTETPDFEKLQEMIESGNEAGFAEEAAQSLTTSFVKITFMQNPTGGSIAEYMTDSNRIKIKGLSVDEYDAVKYTTVSSQNENGDYLAVVLIKDKYWILIDAINASDVFDQMITTFGFLDASY
jgi:hypothetical protein